MMALIVANTPPKRIGSALSIAQTGSVVGQTSGPRWAPCSRRIVPHVHWLFWVSGGLLLTAGALVAIFIREVKQLAPGRYRLQWIGRCASFSPCRGSARSTCSLFFSR